MRSRGSVGALAGRWGLSRVDGGARGSMGCLGKGPTEIDPGDWRPSPPDRRSKPCCRPETATLGLLPPRLWRQRGTQDNCAKTVAVDWHPWIATLWIGPPVDWSPRGLVPPWI